MQTATVLQFGTLQERKKQKEDEIRKKELLEFDKDYCAYLAKKTPAYLCSESYEEGTIVVYPETGRIKTIDADIVHALKSIHIVQFSETQYPCIELDLYSDETQRYLLLRDTKVTPLQRERGRVLFEGYFDDSLMYFVGFERKDAKYYVEIEGEGIQSIHTDVITLNNILEE